MNFRECDFSKRTKAFRDGLKFLIDVDDYEKFVKGESFNSYKGYVRNASGKRIHRLIMNAPDGMDVDHINGDPLDNRKSNLRICSRSQNQMNKGKPKNNTTGFKGVHFYKPSGKFISNIRVDGKNVYLGSFEKSEDAYKAYCEACVKYHQEFHHF